MSDKAATAFTVSHADEADFHSGLRASFEYRALGIAKAMDGRVQAQVIRAKEGPGERGGWHHHECDFQLAYAPKGWVRFEYEGVGVPARFCSSRVPAPTGRPGFGTGRSTVRTILSCSRSPSRQSSTRSP